jgi:hypothetical protein
MPPIEKIAEAFVRGFILAGIAVIIVYYFDPKELLRVETLRIIAIIFIGFLLILQGALYQKEHQDGEFPGASVEAATCVFAGLGVTLIGTILLILGMVGIFLI